MKTLIALALCLLVGSTAPDYTRETLQKSGYTNIEVTGFSPFSCGEDDTFSTGFRADNPQGQRVEGTVCCGMLKSCTVRF